MKKQKKTGRRFVQRVKVKKLEGIGMSLPEDEVNRPTGTRQPTSVAVFTCPLCGAKRYVDQSFFDFVAEVKRVAVEGVSTEHKEAAMSLVPLPRHTPCKAIMHLEMLEETMEHG